jgi:hypothetical protein
MRTTGNISRNSAVEKLPMKPAKTAQERPRGKVAGFDKFCSFQLVEFIGF